MQSTCGMASSLIPSRPLPPAEGQATEARQQAERKARELLLSTQMPGNVFDVRTYVKPFDSHDNAAI